MFSPVAMKRASVVVLERDEHAVLRGLGRLGLVHLVRTKAGEETAPLEPPDRSAEIARCDELLVRLETIRRRLSLQSLDSSGEAAPELTLAQVDEKLKVFEARAGELLERQQSLQDDRHKMEAAVRQLEAYEGLDLPMDQFAGASFLHFATGVMPTENIDELRGRVGPNVVLMALPDAEGRSNVIAVSSRKAHYAMVEALDKSGFQHDTVKVPEGETPETLAAKTRGDSEARARELAKATEAVSALAAEAAPKLGDLYQVAHSERQILDAQQNFPRTEATVLITGWCPKDQVTSVEREMASITHGRMMLSTTDPGDVPEEEIPVLLKHSRLLRPFEMLITQYGLPTYREVEPTFLLAVSWVIMFGMMFGDAGNGAVVVLAGIILLVKGRTVQMRDGGVLLILSGLSSVAFGIFYGSYFGITEVGGHELGRDPLKTFAVPLMMIAVAFGVLFMSIGLVINVVNRLRRRDYLGAFLDKFGVVGIFFYWGCLALLAFVAMGHASSLPWWSLVVVIPLPLVLVAAREPLHIVLEARRQRGHDTGHAKHSMSDAVIESVMEAFEAVLAYTANSISFIRLAAYAMSHAAVLMASFAIGDLIEAGIGGPMGTAMKILFIVIGNAVAIVLEGVVAFVQAMRLEYYEFFGKFFSGSGRAFRPFRL